MPKGLGRNRHTKGLSMRWSILIAAAVAAASVASDVSAQTATPAGAAACSLVRAPGVTAEKLISGGRERT